MKNIMIALSSAIVLSLSTSVTAGDLDVGVIDAHITQIQTGHDQNQDAIIGLISDEFKGNATVLVAGASITQNQANNNNQQTARIGIIGCDCVEERKKGGGH